MSDQGPGPTPPVPPASPDQVPQAPLPQQPPVAPPIDPSWQQPQPEGAVQPTAAATPAAAVPPASPGYAPPVYGGYPPAAPPERRRGWIGWVVAGVLFLFLACGCIAPFALFFSADMDFSDSTGDAIAVVPIDGIIAGTGDYYSGYITPEYLRDQLEQATDDPAVKAIVLRVNSPGGTVAASEELAAYVEECEKPVVVSIGDVGASGAYMLASHADEIWAMPGSSVGSIGVIAEIPNVSGLLDKLGVEFQVITAGENKDAGSPFRGMTPEERALIQGEVDDAYDQFIDIVAEGRGMPRSKVESLATGWAWSGERAQQLGLIDELGTYGDALDAAAKLGEIDGDYDVITYDDPFESIFSSMFFLTKRIDDIAAALEGRPAFGSTRPLPR